MSQSSPFFNRWLSQNGPDQVLSILTDLVDAGAVFAVDAEGKILFWSKGAEKLFGLMAESVLGRACAEALGCDGGHDPCGLAELGSIKAQEVQLKRPGGERLTCYRTARAFFDAEGQFAGALEFLQPQTATFGAIGQWDNDDSFHGILSRDPAMLEAIKIIRNVAETEATVLIRGESGTGKELVARALHQESPRHQQPFLAINCAALTPSLLESELFGHVKGAFTGAVRNHAGVFQRADGGTLFLDEVAELPLELQAKLLRVLQEQSFIPVGGDEAISVDVRIIAATHRSLREEVKAGRFREDLMYRLRVVPVFLPPLRERRLDVNLLLWHQIDRHNLRGRRHVNSIAPNAMRRLLDYQWPGNVRELINVVEYAFAVGRGNELSMEDLPPEFRESTAFTGNERLSPSKHARSQNEVEMIRDAIQVADGNLEAAASYLGMSRATFWRKRKKYKIDS
ncbi:sigma-54 interaction domain-containing protein [Methylomonas albis]|uniref:Sigma 54-interacting transcriptional regulator n=1 Tax=Methylomonas albis TaxID=1854563 RepID=A0ABR9D191_9GAMM|nr:sigma 54-interacting transcriptional regulator [Methylomonas albis]MBD9355989.1 sigma 54-interacting transcriptional regulator [Methylomonas albis]